jgi:hypothetical protein
MAGGRGHRRFRIAPVLDVTPPILNLDDELVERRDLRFRPKVEAALPSARSRRARVASLLESPQRHSLDQPILVIQPPKPSGARV